MGVKDQLRDLEEKVNLGLREAYRKMAEFKKQKKSPLIVSRNGQVTAIPAEKILPTTNAMNPHPSNPQHDPS
jgi:hypothetical protein